ncbi:LOW QUALITY PROTEIN: hypothetical protein MXB_4260 [Myxobolus squamalis]|nr:LOW QUALITY PROTEIN: hypothetical protein MXB_4260 [Myxobolus squamalis]
MHNENTHFSLSKLLNQKIKFDKSMLIVQYHVKIPPSLSCGGAYIKLISDQEDLNLSTFHDITPFTLMFGPDKCGAEKRLHFIFKHKNPLLNVYEEKHFEHIDSNKFSHIFTDDKFHLLKLKIFHTNEFEIILDKIKIASGSLMNDFTPPTNPPKNILDPYDLKPEDWEELEMIVDPKAIKPDEMFGFQQLRGQNQPPFIPDPKAKIPADWLEEENINILNPKVNKPDEETDGEWEPDTMPNPKCSSGKCGKWAPPQIPNPNYKVWTPPMIKNPAFKGIFKPRQIPNPKYFYDEHPYKMQPVAAIGFELLAVNPGIIFDNILVTFDNDISDLFDSITHNVGYLASIYDHIVATFSNKRTVFAFIVILISIISTLLMYQAVPTFLCFKKRKSIEKTNSGQSEENSDLETPLQGPENDEGK